MARPQKPLEEQLSVAEVELQKAKEKVSSWEERIVEIKKQIEDRNMRQAYTLLKQNGVTVEELEELIKKKQQKSKADGDTWHCERCGEKLRMVRDSG